MSDNLRILPLSDCPWMADTCAAWSFSEWGCQVGTRTLDEVVAAYRNSINSEDLPKTWIALWGDKPAGTIRLKMNDHPDRTDLNPWLASLFIHPIYRKHGIARALCIRLETEAKKLGFNKLYLFTATAEKLYESLGWIKIGTVRDPMGFYPEGHEVLMEKML